MPLHIPPSKSINDEFLRAIGAITISFARLEESLFDYTSRLIDPQDFDIGRATLAGMRFSDLQQLFVRLIGVRTSEHPSSEQILERFSQLAEQMRNIREERNRLIHAYWWPNTYVDDDSEVPGSALSIRYTRSGRQSVDE